MGMPYFGGPSIRSAAMLNLGTLTGRIEDSAILNVPLWRCSFARS